MAKEYKIWASLYGKDYATPVFFRVARGIKRSLGGALRGVSRLVKGIGRTLTSLPVLGGLVGGAFGVGKIVEWSVAFAGAGDVIAKTARTAGVSTAFFQRLGHAAELSGVESEFFAAAIQKFARSMGALRGGKGELVEFLKAVSPQMLKALKNTKSSEEAIRLYLAAMHAVKDPGARAKLATIAFGDSAMRMSLLVDKGSESIEEMMREADRLGLVLDGPALKAAEDFTDEVTRLKGAWGGLKAIFGTAFIQAALPYMEQLSAWVRDNRDEIGSMARAFAVDLVEGIKSVATALPKIASAIGSVIDAVSNLIRRWEDLDTIIGIRVAGGARASAAGIIAGIRGEDVGAAIEREVGVTRDEESKRLETLDANRTARAQAVADSRAMASRALALSAMDRLPDIGGLRQATADLTVRLVGDVAGTVDVQRSPGTSVRVENDTRGATGRRTQGR